VNRQVIVMQRAQRFVVPAASSFVRSAGIILASRADDPHRLDRDGDSRACDDFESVLMNYG